MVGGLYCVVCVSLAPNMSILRLGQVESIHGTVPSILFPDSTTEISNQSRHPLPLSLAMASDSFCT